MNECWDPQTIGHKYGPRQWWPVWSCPPIDLANLETARRLGRPPVIGGPCPPDLQVGPYGQGYSCVSRGSFGANEFNKSVFAPVLIGALLGYLLGAKLPELSSTWRKQNEARIKAGQGEDFDTCRVIGGIAGALTGTAIAYAVASKE